MSIRLDPRRLNALKHLSGEAGVRPGDLVRQWVEERIDASRSGEELPAGPAGASLAARVDELTARIAALEATSGATAPPAPKVRKSTPVPESSDPDTQAAADAQPESDAAPEPEAPSPKRGRRNAVSAAPTDERVALHDEMIAVLRERGPMTAAELAGAIAERGRYTPPRSGKALDAAMVSQRVSNPTYRPRFTRAEGRIGLAE